MTDAQRPSAAAAARRSLPRLQEAGLMVVILLLAVVLTMVSDRLTLRDGRVVNNFLRVDNLVPNVLTPVVWLGIMAVGVTLVIVAGGIDISIGAIYGLSALATVAVLQHMPDDAPLRQVLPLGLAVSLGVGLACGLVNGLLVVGLRMHPFIVTLATMSIFRGIALVSVRIGSLPEMGLSVPRALTKGFIAWRWELGSGGGFFIQPVPAAIMLAVVGAAWIYLSATVGGRQIYAVGGNEEAARFSGLPVGWVKLRVYALSGLLAGLAGLVRAGYSSGASTNTGEGDELMVIAAAVVGGASLSGGRGSALGALLGALIIQLIDNGIYIVNHKSIRLGPLVLSISNEYTKIINGCAIIVAVAVDGLSRHVHERRMARTRDTG